MKLRLLLVGLFLSCAISYAQGYYLPKYEPITKNELNMGQNVSVPQYKNDVDFTQYMKNLQRKIKLNWNPPKNKERLRVSVFFTISKNGELSNLKIYKSSRDYRADQAALNAIKASFPYESLPKEFKGQSIDIQFTFDYKTLSEMLSERDKR